MDRNIQRFDITSRTIFRIALILVGFWFVFVIRDVLLMLFAAAVIAAAIEPLANWLQPRRVPRAVTVLAVYLIAILVISSVVTLIIPALTEQLVQLSHALPHLVTTLNNWGVLKFTPEQGSVINSIQDLLFRFGENIGNAGVSVVEQTRNFFSGLASLVFVFIIAFYLVVERDAFKKLFRLVIPREHMGYVEHLIDKVQHGMGKWVLGQLLLAVIVGVVVGVGLQLMGVRYALLLGLVAGVLEIVPVIGPIIAAIPGVAIAFTQSWVLGVAALVFYILVQQAENNLLVPAIMRKTTGLNPLVTIIALLLGARLAGVTGMILSVPLATILSIFWADFFSTDPYDGLNEADTLGAEYHQEDSDHH